MTNLTSERKTIGHCHCMGPIPEGVCLPCNHYYPVYDELTGEDMKECEDCGHQEECHV